MGEIIGFRNRQPMVADGLGLSSKEMYQNELNTLILALWTSFASNNIQPNRISYNCLNEFCLQLYIGVNMLQLVASDRRSRKSLKVALFLYNQLIELQRSEDNPTLSIFTDEAGHTKMSISREFSLDGIRYSKDLVLEGEFDYEGAFIGLDSISISTNPT